MYAEIGVNGNFKVLYDQYVRINANTIFNKQKSNTICSIP